MTAPTVIHGNPSPRVGRRFCSAVLGGRVGVEVDVDVGAVVADVVGGATGWAGDAEPVASTIPSASSPKATARRTGAKVVDRSCG